MRKTYKCSFIIDFFCTLTPRTWTLWWNHLQWVNCIYGRKQTNAEIKHLSKLLSHLKYRAWQLPLQATVLQNMESFCPWAAQDTDKVRIRNPVIHGVKKTWRKKKKKKFTRTSKSSTEGERWTCSLNILMKCCPCLLVFFGPACCSLPLIISAQFG